MRICLVISSNIATAIRTQIWSYHKKVKGHPNIIILINLVRFSLKAFLILEKIFKYFTLYMGIADILFNGTKSFEQIVNILLTKGPMWNLVLIVQVVSEKKTFKDFIILYIYIAQGQG